MMKISSARIRMKPPNSTSCRMSTVWRSGEPPAPRADAPRLGRTRVRGSSSSSKKDKSVDLLKGRTLVVRPGHRGKDMRRRGGMIRRRGR
jgi:hypothetical protein